VLHAAPPVQYSAPFPDAASSSHFVPQISYGGFVSNQRAMCYPPLARRSQGRSFGPPAEAITSAANPPVIHYASPPVVNRAAHGSGRWLHEGVGSPVLSGDGLQVHQEVIPEQAHSLAVPDGRAVEGSADLTIPLTPGPRPDEPAPEQSPEPNVPPKGKAADAKGAEKMDAREAKSVGPDEPKEAADPQENPKPQPKPRKPRKEKPGKRKPITLSTPVLAWNVPESLHSRHDQEIASHEIASRDKIRIDAHNGLDLQSGWVQFPESSKNLLSGIQKSKQFLIVANVTCRNDDQKGPARILSCSKDASARNFTLAQDGHKFVIRIRSSVKDPNGTEHETSFGRVRPGKSQQVAVRYDGRELECYVDGELVAERKFKTDFKSWERFPVVAGNEFSADRPWSGTIHSLVVLPTANRAQLKEFFKKK